jgi:hypothetical protein
MTTLNTKCIPWTVENLKIPEFRLGAKSDEDGFCGRFLEEDLKLAIGLENKRRKRKRGRILVHIVLEAIREEEENHDGN